MDIVDIAVEELQFEYSLFDSFFNEFPEPAMEDGYIPYDTSYKRDQHDKPSNDKSATDNNKDNSSANDSNTNKSTANDKPEEKKKQLADLHKVSKSIIERAFQKSLDEDNKKRDDNDKLAFSGSFVISDDGINATRLAKTPSGDSKIYQIAVKTSNPDHFPNSPDDLTVKSTTNENGADKSGEFVNLKEMSESDLKARVEKSFGQDWEYIGVDRDNVTAYAHNTKTNEWQTFKIPVKTNTPKKGPADPEKVKMYDVNKHRNVDDKVDFISKIESFFKMIFEMITRAINNIKVKFTRAVSGQKSFAKEMEKLQKNKKPNLKLKCKNYLYNDAVIAKLYNALSEQYKFATGVLNKLFNDFNKVKDDPEGFNNMQLPTANGDVALKDAVINRSDNIIDLMSMISEKLGINGQINGEGDFFDAVRKMFRGSVDPVEFQLEAKPEEFRKAFDFIKNYDNTANIPVNKLDETQKDFKRYQTIIGRYKNADIPKSEGRDNFNKMLSIMNKHVVFICSCYTFIVSLLQERLLNCRNLIRRAYGKI